LRDLRSRGGGQEAAVRDDGTFQFVNVGLGTYQVLIERFPRGAYVRSVRNGLIDSEDGVVDLRSGPPRDAITVVVSQAEATVSGTVSGSDELMSTAAVVLIDQQSGDSLLRYTKIGSDRRYFFDGVAPGKYKLVAVDQNQVGSLWQDDEYKDLQEIVVVGSDLVSKDLSVVVPEADPR